MLEGNLISRFKNRIIVLLIVLVVLDFVVFLRIFTLNAKASDLKLYFLDVGQGDSELVVLPGNVKVLIDGGPPNGKVLENLSKIIPPTERYIDLVIMSHPELDHFGGLIEVLKRYKVGSFLTNGRESEIDAFLDLEKVLSENKIRKITIGAEDKIIYKENHFDILSPDLNFIKSKKFNDTAIVAELFSEGSKTLFTGDIGFEVEKDILKEIDSQIDILKVAHHGSKYSTSDAFLSAVSPKIAVIEVGKNSYGHPTKEVLKKLENIGAKIYRTDQDGIIEFLIDSKKIKIFKIN